jgi:hypothetical protein
VFKRVFKTKEEGKAFLSHWTQHVFTMHGGPGARAAFQEELRSVRHTYPPKPPVELFARAHALVSWLEAAGAVVHDANNGAERVFGCELELQLASELARDLGEHLDDPN